MTIYDFLIQCRDLAPSGARLINAMRIGVSDVAECSQFNHTSYGIAEVRIKPDGSVDLVPNFGTRQSGFADAVATVFNAVRTGKAVGDAQLTVDGQPTVGAMRPVQPNLVMLDYGWTDNLNESILDRPQDGLDPAIWQFDGETYVLRPDAEAKIAAVAKWAVSTFGIPNPTVHVVGSATSNSYTPDSDIDLHFVSDEFKPADVDEFNRGFRTAFDIDIKQAVPQYAFIGQHPIEVYFQPNTFQDMMSVGCYDVLERKWETGPELKPVGFDPISKYYKADMKYVDKVIGDIRDMIMNIRETALVFKKSEDAGFRERTCRDLRKKLKDAWRLYQKIRKYRTVQSQPKNKNQAIKKRGNKKWHVADSAFKLLDKFGYLAVLRTCAQLHETGFVAPETAVQQILDSVNQMLSVNDLKEDDVAKLEESAGKTFSIAVLASLLAFPALSGGKSESEVEKLIQKERTYEGVNAALEKDSIEKYGAYSDLQAANILSRTLYAEAQGEGLHGIRLVATTIYNRAGGDANKFADVCFQKQQYSCWNGFDHKNASSYVCDLPENIKDKMSQIDIDVYQDCKDTAVDMLTGKFKPVNNYYNSYYNPDKCDPSWGSKMVKSKTEGSHKFGYLPEHDGNKKKAMTGAEYKKLLAAQEKASEHTVAKGDTLSKLAKKYKTTVKKLKKINGLKDDVIKIGQKLKVKT